jgi:hypothetical protein
MMGASNTLFGTLAALTLTGAAVAAPLDDLLGSYQSQGTGPFSADRGAPVAGAPSNGPKETSTEP